MKLLKGVLILLLALTTFTVTHGGGKGGSKHVHFRIHVPEFIKHNHHTKTVYIHVGGHGGGHGHHGHGHGHHHGHGHGHGHHQVYGHGHHYGHDLGHHHGHGHWHHHGHGPHHGHGGHHTHEVHYLDLHHGHGGGHGGHHHTHKVHEKHNVHSNPGTMSDEHDGHKTEHMQILSHTNILNDQQQPGGYDHSGFKNDLQGDKHYTPYEAKGEGGDQKQFEHGSGKDTSWTYGGHGHSFESGGKLVGSDVKILSGSNETHSDDLIKHIDHPSSFGSSDDYNHTPIPSGGLGGATGGDYNDLGHGQNQFGSGEYVGLVGGDYKNVNTGHDHGLRADNRGVLLGGYNSLDHGSYHVSSENYGRDLAGGRINANKGHAHLLQPGYMGEMQGGHSILDNGHDNISSENYGIYTVGGQVHVDSGLSNDLNKDHFIGSEGGQEHAHVLNVIYREGNAGIQNHMDMGYDQTLGVGYGGETGSYISHTHDNNLKGVNEVNLGVGHNLVQHGGVYDKNVVFGKEMERGHDKIKYISNSDGYKVHENVREDNQDPTRQNYGVGNHAAVHYIDQKTAMPHGGASVHLESNELDGYEHKQLHKENGIATNSYRDGSREF